MDKIKVVKIQTQFGIVIEVYKKNGQLLFTKIAMNREQAIQIENAIKLVINKAA